MGPYWIVGFYISLVFGHIATELLSRALDNIIYKKIEKADYIKEGIDLIREKDVAVISFGVWITGAIERTFFTIAVAYEVGGTIIAMIGWITIKMGINWARTVDTAPGRALALRSLLCGMFSMLFALIGGLIIHQGLNQ